MKNIAKYIISSIAIIFIQDVQADCTIFHEECEYICIQYYPNGTDCWKSKKICKKVCDDFDVNPSGGTPHGQYNNQSQSTQNIDQPQSNQNIDINTNPLQPPTAGCASASGDGSTTNCH